MSRYSGSRLAATLLAFASLFAAPYAQAQSWSPVAGAFQGGAVRALFVPSLGSATAVGDSWAAVYGGGMFKQAPSSSTWVPMNTGLTDKRVYSFTLTTTSPYYRGYAATRGGGVFRTTDGGANWTAVNNGLGCTYVRSVSFIGVGATGTTAFTNGIGASASTDRLLASTDCDANGGVYLSIDGGANWSATTGMPPGVWVQNVTRVRPTSSIDFLLAATYSGVYKSTDNGLTWTSSNGAITSPNGSNINGITFLYTGSTAALTIYATEANTGVWKSTDNGASWGTAPVLNKITTAAVFTDGNGNGNLYFTADGEGIYKSADRGANWTLFVSNAALPGANGITRNTASIDSPIFYARTFAGIFRSADGGGTWTKESTGLSGGYTVNLQSDTGGNAYVAAAEGVYKASPGGTFQRLGGYNLGIFWSGGHIIVTPTDVPYAITSHLGVFKFDGTNWVAKNTGLPNMTRQGNSLRVDPNNVNGLYLGLRNGGGVYYSADGGESWTAKNTGLTGDARNIRTLLVTPAYTVVSTDDGMYRSTNTGATWTRLPFAAKSPANVELPAGKLRFDAGDASIYASVFQTDPVGTAYPGSGIWRSADAGATWTQLLAGKRAADINVARNASGVTLYAGLWDTVGGGALQSTDGGATWTAINSGLTAGYIQNFAGRGGELKGLASLDEGVFRFTPPAVAESLNVIANWNLLGNGMSTPLTVATAFSDASKINTVWKWVPASSNWAFYTPTLADGGAAFAASKGYAFLTSIAAGEGFWVNAKTAFTQALAGNAVTATSFRTTLGSGWSLIAIGDRTTPSAFNRAVANSLTPPSPGVVPTSISTLWAWDATRANWYFYAPSLESSGGLAAYIGTKSYLDFGDEVLEPTVGFWVNK